MNASELSVPASLTEEEKQQEEFDQLKLRLWVGVIAFLLPILTPLVAFTPLTSISASYYTNARDIFVGVLFVIGTLLWAYNGRSSETPDEQEESKIRSIVRKILRVDRKGEQGVVTTLGGLAAIAAALYPTACNTCTTNPRSVIHYFSAFILFATTVYICLFVFRYKAIAKAKKKEIEGISGTKQKRRAGFYLGCGLGIIVCMAGAGGAQLVLPAAAEAAWGSTFVAEAVALWLFATAWMVASRYFPWFADDDERPRLMQPTLPEQQAQAGA
jgi:hypothetical protein